jgi:uncharacterized damage-inducible protein DinB
VYIILKADMHSEITRLFLVHSTKKLRQMCAHIESCLARLTDGQIWSRGAAHENSIGNLVLHLCGNVRQWIGAGVGGEQDIRDRDREFSTRAGMTTADLLSHLKQTVDHAVAIVDRVTPARLLDEINPQTGQVSVLEAIYQVVGHFQQHTGQIIFATKMLAGEDLGIWRKQERGQDVD